MTKFNTSPLAVAAILLMRLLPSHSWATQAANPVEQFLHLMNGVRHRGAWMAFGNIPHGVYTSATDLESGAVA